MTPCHFICLLAQTTKESVEVIHKTEVSWADRWQQLLFTIASLALAVIGAYVTYVIVPYIKTLKAKNESDTNQSNASVQGQIKNEVKTYILGMALAIAEKNFPDLARRVLEGQVRTADDVKAELKRWGETLKQSLRDEFARQYHIDVVDLFGNQYLDDLIERSANLASPFPGRETSPELIKPEAAEKIARFGVDYVRKLYSVSPPDAPALPATRVVETIAVPAVASQQSPVDATNAALIRTPVLTVQPRSLTDLTGNNPMDQLEGKRIS